MQEKIELIGQGIRESMETFKVAGCSLALIKDNKVIHLEGFGKRNIKTDEPVDKDTVFAIGSSSKAFATATMAILADRGLLEWDRPLKDYVPWFKMYDKTATDHMTPRDIVSHRSGLPRHELLWYGTSFSREELVRRLRYLEPNKDFRSYLQYQNLMYMTAGYLVEAITGSTWEEFTAAELFKPLQMKRSNTSVRTTQRAKNFSQPYAASKGKIVEVPFKNIDVIAPAGSINSSAADMANWVLMHLNDGMFNKKEIISQSNLFETHRPNMVITGDFFGEIEKFPEFKVSSYGLGWFISNYRGRTLINHGGNIDGFTALVSFMPDEGLGVVLLSNQNGSMHPYVSTWLAYDVMLGLEPAPWRERCSQLRDQGVQQFLAGRKWIADNKVKGTKPSHKLSDYAGEYEHPGYGKLTIKYDKKALKAYYNDAEFSVTHYHYDTFSLEFKAFNMLLQSTFTTDANGNIVGITVPMEASLPGIVFDRVPEKQLTDPKTLKKFAGNYDYQDRVLKVSLRASALYAAIPGLPEVELLPYKDARFNVKGSPELVIEFVVAGNGKVTGIDVLSHGMLIHGDRTK